VEEEGREREGARARERPLGPGAQPARHRVKRERREHHGQQHEQVGGGEEPDRPRQQARDPVLRLVLAQEVVPARAQWCAKLGDEDASERAHVAVLGGA
jgi:hypothetical protein